MSLCGAGGGLHAKRVISFLPPLLEDLLATSPYFFRHAHRVAQMEHISVVLEQNWEFSDSVPFARLFQNLSSQETA